MVEENTKNNGTSWAIAVHLSALLGIIGFPFGNILGPLFIWRFKQKEFPSIIPHAKAALNFQISMTLYCIIAGLLFFIYIGFPLLIVLIILNVAWIIKASKEASDDKLFHYPLSIPFIK